MEIRLNNRHEKEYFDKCHLELIKQCEVSDIPYIEREIVENACKICISTLVKEFELLSAKIISTSEIASLFYIYANFSESKDDIPENDRVIVRNLCRYLFGEFTKLGVDSSIIKDLDEQLISRLFFITKLISNFSENLYEMYVTDKTVFQLELYDSTFDIRINDKDYSIEQKRIKKNLASELLKGSCFTEDKFEDTLNKIESYFGDAASALIDKFTEPQNLCINASSIGSFAEFMAIVNSNIHNERDRCNVLELTDLINVFNNDPFISGLILRRQNVNLEKSIHKPHDINLRSRFRPIIEIKVNGINKYITTKQMIFEAFDQLISNQIPFSSIPEEWKQNKQMLDYTKRQQELHDKWLEDPSEKILENNDFIYLRHIENINGINIVRAPVENSNKTVGEIDFIIVDTIKSNIYIADCKYIKRKDNFASFVVDRNSFAKENGYNMKLSHKIDWISKHPFDLAEELKIDLDLSKFTVEGLFITNSFVYYGLYSPYPIISIKQLDVFFSTGERLLTTTYQH